MESFVRFVKTTSGLYPFGCSCSSAACTYVYFTSKLGKGTSTSTGYRSICSTVKSCLKQPTCSTVKGVKQFLTGNTPDKRGMCAPQPTCSRAQTLVNATDTTRGKYRPTPPPPFHRKQCGVKFSFASLRGQGQRVNCVLTTTLFFFFCCTAGTCKSKCAQDEYLDGLTATTEGTCKNQTVCAVEGQWVANHSATEPGVCVDHPVCFRDQFLAGTQPP